MSHNVISLHAAKQVRQAEDDDAEYRAMILGMDKLELLEEMIRFQEERSRTGHLSLSMMVRGRILFGELERNAETSELQLLTRSYRRHLDCELAEFIKTGRMNA